MSSTLLLLGAAAALLLFAGSAPSAAPPSPPSPPNGGGSAPTPPAKPPVKPAPPTNNPPILVIGDSLGVGLAPPLKAHLGSVVGAAKNGATVATWSNEAVLGSALASTAPAVVVISLGTNDIAGGHAFDGTDRAKIRRIVDRVREAGGVPVWIGPPTLPTLPAAREAQFRAVLAAELADAGVPLFLSELIPFERAPDQIHATPKGYDQWAELIAAWLADLGLVENATSVALRRAGLAGVR